MFKKLFRKNEIDENPVLENNIKEEKTTEVVLAEKILLLIKSIYDISFNKDIKDDIFKFVGTYSNDRKLYKVNLESDIKYVVVSYGYMNIGYLSIYYAKNFELENDEDIKLFLESKPIIRICVNFWNFGNFSKIIKILEMENSVSFESICNYIKKLYDIVSVLNIKSELEINEYNTNKLIETLEI
jgi:hypothetical protein